MTDENRSDAPSANAVPNDPQAWLEEIEGAEQLAWVRARNAESAASLADTERFARIESEILEVLTSQDKIPAVSQRGERLYNFWTDSDHERGLWRRTTWDSYRTDSPEWEILLDL
ncbi:MAG: S9 family peptidase, partial [Ruaniaceae bacterium]|nr:S9 family peptidase [Ruaniaceae bacterium]